MSVYRTLIIMVLVFAIAALLQGDRERHAGKFEVGAYRAPRRKGEIVFLREGFGPGDIVKASLHVERAQSGIPAGAAVHASAIVDGADVFNGNTKVDSAGNLSVGFKLPTQID